MRKTPMEECYFSLICRLKKREKHPWRSVNFSRIADFSVALASTLLKVTLLHGCCLHFLNCRNGI